MSWGKEWQRCSEIFSQTKRQEENNNNNNNNTNNNCPGILLCPQGAYWWCSLALLATLSCTLQWLAWTRSVADVSSLLWAQKWGFLPEDGLRWTHVAMVTRQVQGPAGMLSLHVRVGINGLQGRHSYVCKQGLKISLYHLPSNGGEAKEPEKRENSSENLLPTGANISSSGEVIHILSVKPFLSKEVLEYQTKHRLNVFSLLCRPPWWKKILFLQLLNWFSIPSARPWARHRD